MQFKGIRAVFVDAGGVLVVNRAREVGERFEREYGLTKETTRSIFHFLHEKGRAEEEKNDILREKGVDRDVWDKFTRDFYDSESRNEELYQELKRARKEGVKIILTTNNVSAAKKISEKYGVADIIDIFVSSAEIGVTKPQREFWKKALEKTREAVPDIRPEEILVIDDSEENIESAKEFGLNVFKY